MGKPNRMRTDGPFQYQQMEILLPLDRNTVILTTTALAESVFLTGMALPGYKKEVVSLVLTGMTSWAVQCHCRTMD